MNSGWFDFRGFPGKAAELNRLHKPVQETNEIRMCSNKGGDKHNCVKHSRNSK